MSFKKISVLVATGALVLTMSAGVAYGATDNISTSINPAKSVTEQVGSQDNIQHRGCGTQFAEILGIDAKVLGEELKSGKTLGKIATEKGIDVKELTTKLEKNMNDRIDKAVTEGKLTNDKAVEMKSKTSERVSKAINEPMKDHKGKKSKGNVFMNVREQLPALLHMDADQLQIQLKSGKSLVNIAEDNKIDKDTLKLGMQKIMKENLNQALKDNKITPEKAATIESKMPQMIERMVTRVPKEK